jgi:long-chain acyl-CoA synthetase
VEPAPRPNLLSYLDDMRRLGRREAYLWREGVRWRSRSFGSVHRRSLGCAAALRELGVGEGDAVLVQGPDGADWVEALFGTLRLGAIVVPLEQETPEELRRAIADQVEASAIVAPASIPPPGGMPRLRLGSWGEEAEAGLPEVVPGHGHRAEIVFTSGTTGDPKGVVLTHGNLVADLAPIEHGYRKRERLRKTLGRLRLLSTLPLSHMFGQAMGIFLPVAMGLTVAFTPPKPAELMGGARRLGAWGAFCVPRTLDVLAGEVRRRLRADGKLEGFERRHARLARWPRVAQALLHGRVRRMLGWRFRLFVVGGAPLPEEVHAFWDRLGYLVVQGYGLTETSPIVSVSNPLRRSSASVGRPLHGQEVRLGDGGEVLVRGPNVTPGYLGKDGAAEGSGAIEDGWFRTGDIGEIDESGRLRIRGRIKEVIVTQEGENVHPGDVEEALRAAPGVRDAAVIGVPHARGSGEIVHAALLLDGGTEGAEAVRLANERLLPKQRIRGWSAWPGEDLPRTPGTGKVQRGRVRDAVLAREEGGEEEASPSGVRALIAEVARTRPAALSKGTTLAEGLGLGSLDLVELASAIESEYGVGLAEETLAGATVGEIEGLVAAAWSAPEAAPRPAGSAGDAGTVEGIPAGGFAARPGVRGSLRMPRWARLRPLGWLRRAFEEAILFPFVRYHARPEIVGRERLEGLERPFLLVGNHRSYIDTPLAHAALPWRLRGRLAPAMTTRLHRAFFGERAAPRLEYLLEWLEVRAVQLLFHGWPLPETAGFRRSLSYSGELADEGFSLLVFPEGRHVREGTREPFREGTGLLARALRLPVVPVWMDGTAGVLPAGARWPHRGRTRVVFGAPISIEPGKDASAVTRRIEEAVRRLADADTDRS